LRERVDELGRGLERFLFERYLWLRFFDGRLANAESRRRSDGVGGRVVRGAVLLSSFVPWSYKTLDCS